jgi:hypothetical protein
MVFVDEVEKPGLASNGLRITLIGIVHSHHFVFTVTLLCHLVSLYTLDEKKLLRTSMKNQPERRAGQMIGATLRLYGSV